MIPGMKLTASSKIVKYLMFIFNLLFVITGIILLSIGLAIHGVYTDYAHFLDNKFFSVPSLLIVVGAIIFVIAFFGCCGAARENHCMILTFASLMILVFVLELTAGISGYLLRGHATSIVGEKMNETMSQYNKSKEIAFVWDELQQNFKCCGTNSSADWTPIFKLKDELPMSCCEVQTGAIGNVTCTTTSKNVYPDGCLPNFLTYVKAHAMQLGSVGLGIAFVQAIGIWFSIYLARSIRSSYETV